MSASTTLENTPSGQPTQEKTRYIVWLEDGVNKEDWISEHCRPGTSHVVDVIHNYHPGLFNGFVGEIDGDLPDWIRPGSHHDDGVKFVFEDQPCEVASSGDRAVASQTNAPWGLSRICQDDPLIYKDDPENTSFTYKFHSTDVDVYVVDSGIKTDHVQFFGRARWGVTIRKEREQPAPDTTDTDDFGHGTYIAGVIAASQLGVAKSVNLIAVKVIGNNGGGKSSDVIAGFDWVYRQAKISGNPSIVNASIITPRRYPECPVIAAVDGLTRSGIHVIAVAGNRNEDVEKWSPASAPSAITVASCNIQDFRDSDSNYGSAVHIFAPGDGILTTSNESTTATTIKSGTCLATPHVTGLVSYLVGAYGNKSPAMMKILLKVLSIPGALQGVPENTPNRLARNDVNNKRDISAPATYVIRNAAEMELVIAPRIPDDESIDDKVVPVITSKSQEPCQWVVSGHGTFTFQLHELFDKYIGRNTNNQLHVSAALFRFTITPTGRGTYKIGRPVSDDVFVSNGADKEVSLSKPTSDLSDEWYFEAVA